MYAAVNAAIRSGAYPLGSMLPSDAELTAQLGVSRTVIREALLLLEEDKLIHTRRGVGRFVAEAMPVIGLERLRPIDELLESSGGGTLVLEQNFSGLQKASDFLVEGLGLAADGQAWVTETVLSRDGEPLCFSVECIPDREHLRSVAPELAESFDALVRPGSTVLAQITALSTAPLGPASSEIGTGTAGESRAALLGVGRNSPILVLTQRVGYRGHPVYLGKHVITPSAGTLRLTQS